MVIEKISEGDIPLISDLQPEGWHNIVPIFQFYIHNRYWCFPVKIIIDTRLAAIGCGISFDATGWLAHIIVRPDYQKQGIGSSVVKYLCNLLAGKKAKTIYLLATESGFPVYQKIGFIEETEYLFFDRESNPGFGCSANIIDYSNKYREQILVLDKEISGENRLPLLQNHLQESFIFVNNNKVSGFYMPYLGEGLILANDTEAGIELMKLRYMKNTSGVLPIDNLKGTKFLRENGFKESKRAKRMVLGEHHKWQPDKVFNRISGYFG